MTAPAAPHTAPSPVDAALALTVRTVLVPTDDSRTSQRALTVAGRLADRLGATIDVLRVEMVAPGQVVDDRIPPRVGEDDREILIQAPNPGVAIAETAEALGADLIVMGTHGRSGYDRAVLGSTAERVLRMAPCPVLTVGPESGTHLGGPVLAPVAFEGGSDEALRTGAAFAALLGEPLHALHVVEPLSVPMPYGLSFPAMEDGQVVGRAREALTRWTDGAAGRLVPSALTVRIGRAVPTILDLADDLGAGLVVQGSHGRRGLDRVLLGSVAEGVARRAPCPVLTLRTGCRRIVTHADGPDLPAPLSREAWPALFERFANLTSGGGWTATVTVNAPEGAPWEAVFRDAPLTGVGFDPRADAIEVYASGSEHHVVHPFAVFDTSEGDTLAVEVVRADGARERIALTPGG